MAGKREDLHTLLCGIVDHVYFQPPATVKLSYPCIVYSLSGDKPRRADNLKYFYKKRYTVTVVDRDADSELPDKVGVLPYCNFDRVYTGDGFYHYAYTLYF